MFHEVSSSLKVIEELCNIIVGKSTRYKQDIYDSCATYQYMLNLLCFEVARHEDKLTIKQQSIIKDRIISTQEAIDYILDVVAEE